MILITHFPLHHMACHTTMRRLIMYNYFPTSFSSCPFGDKYCCPSYHHTHSALFTNFSAPKSEMWVTPYPYPFCVSFCAHFLGGRDFLSGPGIHPLFLDWLTPPHVSLSLPLLTLMIFGQWMLHYFTFHFFLNFYYYNRDRNLSEFIRIYQITGNLLSKIIAYWHTPGYNGNAL